MDITIDATERVSISIFGCKAAGLVEAPVLSGDIKGRSVSRELTIGGQVEKIDGKVVDVYQPVIQILFFD